MKFGVSSYVWVSPFSDETLGQLMHAKEIGFDIYELAVEDPASFSTELVKTAAGLWIFMHAPMTEEHPGRIILTGKESGVHCRMCSMMALL